MRCILGVGIAFCILSNIFLWMNLWNLKNALSKFQRKNIELLKELCQQPSEDGGTTESPLDTMLQAVQQAIDDIAEA